MSEYTEKEIAEMRERANKDNFTIEIKKRIHGDSDDIYYFDKNKKHVGSGFIPKEGDKKDQICLTQCPACRRENYYANVLAGVCTWCPFNANGDND